MQLTQDAGLLAAEAGLVQAHGVEAVVVEQVGRVGDEVAVRAVGEEVLGLLGEEIDLVVLGGGLLGEDEGELLREVVFEGRGGLVLGEEGWEKVGHDRLGGWECVPGNVASFGLYSYNPVYASEVGCDMLERES